MFVFEFILRIALVQCWSTALSLFYTYVKFLKPEAFYVVADNNIIFKSGRARAAAHAQKNQK